MTDAFLTSLTVDSRQKPLIAFDRAPPVGFVLRINWFRRNAEQVLTLEHVDRYVRTQDRAETCVLTWRDGRGILYKSGLRGYLRKRQAAALDFTAPPEPGFRLTHDTEGKALPRPLTLEAVEPYTRKTDGGASFLLTWRDDEGERYRSGMRGPYPKREPDAD